MLKLNAVYAGKESALMPWYDLITIGRWRGGAFVVEVEFDTRKSIEALENAQESAPYKWISLWKAIW